MGERLTVVSRSAFEYTEEDIKAGIRKVKEDLIRFKEDLASNDPRMVNAARQIIPHLERSLEYVNRSTPDQMIGELRIIYNGITILEGAGASSEEIDDVLLKRANEILTYRSLLNRGWLETTAQRVIAASVRRR